MEIRIATRKSQLALWQAEHVAARLRDLSEVDDVSLVPLSTRGDEILDKSLQKIGGKGLFIKELEVAMQQLQNKDSQLVDFIKYDTTLGREQNIDINKESSLSNFDRMDMRGGVKLTQFRPEKPGQEIASTIEETGSGDEGTPVSGQTKEKKVRKLNW